MQLNLITIEEARDAIDIANKDLDSRLSIVAEFAEQWAERELGVRFKAEERTEYHTGGNPFVDPKIYPLVSVTSIADSWLDGEALTADDDYTVRGNLIYRGASGAPNWIWPGGFDRYLVTYVGGYQGTLQIDPPDGSEAAPSGIKLVVLALVRRVWLTYGGIGSEKQDKKTVTWNDLADSMLTLLNPFRLKTGF